MLSDLREILGNGEKSIREEMNRAVKTAQNKFHANVQLEDITNNDRIIALRN